MACRLVGAKALSESMLGYHNLDRGKKLHWRFHQNSYIFVQENSFENVVCQNGRHFVLASIC